MGRTRNWICITFLICSFALSLSAQQTAVSTVSSVPPIVKFGGVLTDSSGKPLAGTVGVTFSLYKDQQGGSPLWMETQNVQLDRAGHYLAVLGSTTSQGLPADLFLSGEARWVGVRAQGQPEQARVLLLSVPYALKAGDAATVGGLPPSAFVLAVPTGGAAPSTSSPGSDSNQNPPTSVSGGGKSNYIPIWTGTTKLGNSVLFQSGKGVAAKVGIGTTTPASTLDVNGSGTIHGLFSLPATGTATAGGGFNSQPIDQVTSAFNSSTNTAVPQTFQWQAEPVGNNTSSATGSLNLLFAQGTGKPSETGLNIASNGQITFAPGQAFPGVGTVTSVGSGAGLTGGPITGTGTLSIANGGVTNAMLANPSLTVNAGTALTGGGPVSLGGSTTLNVDTTKVVTGVLAGTDLLGGGTGGVQTLNLDTSKVPQLAAANTFTGNQTVNGNLSATGIVSGNSYQLGSQLFAFGTYNSENAFLGFGGNPATTGAFNVATGYGALISNTTGNENSANGALALAANTTGGANTAIGTQALFSNTTGNLNTANGASALQHNTTGIQNTAVGVNALGSNTTGSDNTASGEGALSFNSTGGANVASGFEAMARTSTGGNNTGIGSFSLELNTTGSNNTALGLASGYTPDQQNTTGSNNTFVGYFSVVGGPNETTVSNATAVGAQAEVGQSNALVLGSINGVNGASADTTVGIGTTTPVLSGLPDNSTTTLNIVGNNTYVPLVVQSPSTFGTWMLLNNTSSGGKDWAFFSAASGNAEGAGNLGITNFTGNSTIYLEGNVSVSSNLSKGGGSFKIDHPLDPANKYLYHSFVESPDMMNVYNGNVTTSKQGLATVVLPDYFEALNRDFRYQLTVIGRFAQAIVAKEVRHNRFTIKTSKPGVKVSWQVTGIRQDAYANAHRIQVEEEKSPQEQGRYLHPELFGAPPEQAIGMRPTPAVKATPAALLAEKKQ